MDAFECVIDVGENVLINSSQVVMIGDGSVMVFCSPFVSIAFSELSSCVVVVVSFGCRLFDDRFLYVDLRLA